MRSPRHLRPEPPLVPRYFSRQPLPPEKMSSMHSSAGNSPEQTAEEGGSDTHQREMIALLKEETKDLTEQRASALDQISKLEKTNKESDGKVETL
ncbi:Uu.00g073870.m01.CDS01 [Anthostomella pinea]|uniref:Uu.00g073870.m01.CDS01 n=1 Tax=Anthostomella pinea TaxID=933095 RepID=A0AAI8YLK8_9PEZI|nr:Uu.00g073870.m01.CDS01 [Anthostomella pinea]